MYVHVPFINNMLRIGKVATTSEVISLFSPHQHSHTMMGGQPHVKHACNWEVNYKDGLGGGSKQIFETGDAKWCHLETVFSSIWNSVTYLTFFQPSWVFIERGHFGSVSVAFSEGKILHLGAGPCHPWTTLKYISGGVWWRIHYDSFSHTCGVYQKMGFGDR